MLRRLIGRDLVETGVLVVIAGAIPVAGLMVLGLVWLFEHDQVLLALFVWLLLSLAIYGALAWRNYIAGDSATRRQSTGAARLLEEDLPDHLPERPDWSTRDQAVWGLTSHHIDTWLEADPDWRDLPELTTLLLARVAEQYHPERPHAEFRFTLPEALLITSIASQRYRQVIIEHVPFADQITIASAIRVYKHQPRAMQGYRWFDRVRRAARLVNPTAAVIGEARDFMTRRLVGRLSVNFQRQLKTLLLQEVAQVAIDLYSGRLKISDQDIAQHASTQVNASTRPVETLPAVRVQVLGQAGTARADLISALGSGEVPAESGDAIDTDCLRYPATFADGSAMELIDCPDISTDPERSERLQRAMQHSDVLVWLLRARQPARAADKQLRDTLTAFFANDPDRRPPVILWCIRDEDTAETREQRAAIETAVQAQLDLSDQPLHWLPVDADAAAVQLQTLLLHHLGDARQVQLNRRRVAAGRAHGRWQEKARRAGRSGVALGKALGRRIGRQWGSKPDR